MPFERRKGSHTGHLSAHVAGVIAVFIITATTGLGIAWLSISLVTESLRSEQRSAQQAVAEAVQRSVDKALAHGIPLTAIEGLTEYLDDMSRRIAGTRAIEVRSDAGFRAIGGEPGSAKDTLVLPLASPGAEIVVYRDDGPVTGAFERLQAQALILALAAALLASALLWLLALRPLARAHRHLAAVIDALSGGDFTQAATVHTATPADMPLQEARALTREVNAHYATMHFQAESLRAIDFDDSLAPMIDEAVERACGGRRFASDPVAEKTL
ncbi:hypothetical protein [Microvirga sp. M2]|uniref:hypothetical protein n=1 Tax=Microvirga sp. M2 TaxID=3073270 RepID=UPI0039C2F73A